MTLRRDASEVEKAALDEKSNATRGVSDTRGQWKSVTQTISHSQRQLVSLKRQWSKRTGHSLNEEHEQSKFCNRLRSQDPFCCDWRWICETQNSLRSQAWWRLGPVALGNEGPGQGTPRQRDLELSETTHRQGRHTRQVGLQKDIGTYWSNRQIQNTLCGRSGLLWEFCTYL